MSLLSSIRIPEYNKDNLSVTVQDLYDSVYRLRKELEFMLYNLDEDNVVKAKSVVSEWVYAGSIYANQIDVTVGKITTAQIEDLTVGGNVTMGENARISWQKVDDIPTDLVYAEDISDFVTDGVLSNTLADLITNSNLSTILAEDYIITGSLLASQIAAGDLTLTGTMKIGTDTSGKKRLELNVSGLTSYDSSNKQDGISIESGAHSFSRLAYFANGSDYGGLEYDTFGRLVLSTNSQVDIVLSSNGSMDISSDKDMTIEAATGKSVYPESSWDFKYASVDNLKGPNGTKIREELYNDGRYCLNYNVDEMAFEINGSKLELYYDGSYVGYLDIL